MLAMHGDARNINTLHIPNQQSYMSAYVLHLCVIVIVNYYLNDPIFFFFYRHIRNIKNVIKEIPDLS